MSAKILLGDLSNGSVFKLALSQPGMRPEAVSHYACGSFSDFQDAIFGFIGENDNPLVIGAAFSTSGWEVDGQIDLVHYGFALDRQELSALLGVPYINVVNDFVAKALAVPVLEAHERVQVCGQDRRPDQVVAVVGPTAGLGGAFLAPNGRGGWVANHCEGGHSDLAPCNDLEIEILRIMARKYGHVSCERAVSAPGLTELWRCLAVIDGQEAAPLTIEEILVQALIGETRAKTAIRVQTELYAGMASDFALTVGARGGVYLCGSYLDALGDLFDHAVFANRFYDKGRVSSYLRDVPVYKIVAQEPEILGIGTLFD